MAEQTAAVATASPAPDRIRAARRAARLTQDELGPLVRLTGGRIAQFETGRGVPNETTARLMARALANFGVSRPWWYYQGLDADPYGDSPYQPDPNSHAMVKPLRARSPRATKRGAQPAGYRPAHPRVLLVA